MDGFALGLRAGERRSTFRLRADPLRRLGHGEAFPIATGATLPLGASAVARRESCRVAGDQLHLVAPVPVGRDVHLAGASIARGTVIAVPERSIDGYAWAALLAAGTRRVPVEVLRITVFPTGDELARARQHGRPPVDTIGPWIASVTARWATVRRGPALPDEVRRIRSAIESACPSSDLVVTIGGTSVGPKDRTKPAVAAAGNVVVGGTQVNVLKRAGVGWVRRRPVLMLPGQVEGAVVAFHEFGLRLIGRMRGIELGTPESRRLAVGFTVDHRMDSTVLFERSGERVRPLGWGVNRYHALLRAEWFGYFARGRTYRRGQEIAVQRFIRDPTPEQRPASGRTLRPAPAVRRPHRR
jgi:molybdenum cofactor synthesis domain-containing protein